MDIHKLKAFVVVAENLNFRKSAELLAMSQPPLTRLIASLEEELETPLFERTTRRVKLTAAGILLLKEARQVLAMLDKLEIDVRSIGKIKKGALTIGFSPNVFFARFPIVLDEFKNRFRHVKVELVQDSKLETLRGVVSGRFDVGFVEALTTFKTLSSQPVQDERMGVLVRKNHPLAKKKEISLEELGEETIIVHPREEAPEFHDRLVKMLRALTPRPKLYLKKKNEVCPILVATGKGVSLTIAQSSRFVPQETAFVPIKDLFLPVSVFWKAENANPSLSVFLGFITENASLEPSRAECLMAAAGDSSKV